MNFWEIILKAIWFFTSKSFEAAVFDRQHEKKIIFLNEFPSRFEYESISKICVMMLVTDLNLLIKMEQNWNWTCWYGWMGTRLIFIIAFLCWNEKINPLIGDFKIKMLITLLRASIKPYKILWKKIIENGYGLLRASIFISKF